MFLPQRVHLFPFRTQKLSSAEPKILAWRRAGKIGHCRHIYRETWVRRWHAVSVSLVYLLLLYSSLTHAGRFASKPHLTSWAGREWTLGSSKFTIQYSSLAQSVEHLTVNQGVVGSSPTGGAKKSKSFLGLGFFYPLRKQWHIINTALPCCISSVRKDCISSRVSVYQKAFAMMIYNF